MIHLKTAKQLLCVNIDQERKCSFIVTMINVIKCDKCDKCDCDKLLIFLKITTKNEVQLEYIAYISRLST